MKVTDVNRTKRGRYSIFIDGEFYGVLHEEIYFRNRVAPGTDIEPEYIDELIYESQIIIAKERALRLLSARSYTKKGLIEKLMRDVDEKASESVAARMEELGLIDDFDYARRYASDCIKLRGYSHKRTMSALYQKRLDRETIEKALASLEPEDAEFMIVKQVKKKYINKLEDEKDRQRTINSLMRFGFEYRDIQTVISHLREDVNYYDNYWEE